MELQLLKLGPADPRLAGRSERQQLGDQHVKIAAPTSRSEHHSCEILDDNISRILLTVESSVEILPSQQVLESISRCIGCKIGRDPTFSGPTMAASLRQTTTFHPLPPLRP